MIYILHIYIYYLRMWLYVITDLELSRFDAIVVPSEVGYEKPAPEIFKIALGRDKIHQFQYFEIGIFVISILVHCNRQFCQIVEAFQYFSIDNYINYLKHFITFQQENTSNTRIILMLESRLIQTNDTTNPFCVLVFENTSVDVLIFS